LEAPSRGSSDPKWQEDPWRLGYGQPVLPLSAYNPPRPPHKPSSAGGLHTSCCPWPQSHSSLGVFRQRLDALSPRPSKFLHSPKSRLAPAACPRPWPHPLQSPHPHQGHSRPTPLRLQPRICYPRSQTHPARDTPGHRALHSRSPESGPGLRSAGSASPRPWRRSRDRLPLSSSTHSPREGGLSRADGLTDRRTHALSGALWVAVR
jgi:hypothetical protein